MYLIRRPLRAFSLVALLAATSVQAAAPATNATRPEAASAPASMAAAPVATASTAATADLSSPAATVKSLLTAINKADFATVRACLDIPAANSADTDALLGTMEATAGVQKAAAARFLDGGAKAFGNPTPAQLAAQLKAIAAADVSIKGTSAALTLTADPANQLPGGTVELKLIDGDWKVNGAAFFKFNTEPADKTADRVALARKITAISNDIAKQIAAGKFFSANEAYQEYWTRCHAAAEPAAPAPSTAPATTPAVSMPASK